MSDNVSSSDPPSCHATSQSHIFPDSCGSCCEDQGQGGNLPITAPVGFRLLNHTRQWEPPWLWEQHVGVRALHDACSQKVTRCRCLYEHSCKNVLLFVPWTKSSENILWFTKSERQKTVRERNHNVYHDDVDSCLDSSPNRMPPMCWLNRHLLTHIVHQAVLYPAVALTHSVRSQRGDVWDFTKNTVICIYPAQPQLNFNRFNKPGVVVPFFSALMRQVGVCEFKASLVHILSFKPKIKLNRLILL